MDVRTMPEDSAYKTFVADAPRDDLGIRAETRQRRIRILTALVDGPMTVRELREALAGQSYVSNDVGHLAWYRHLKHVGWGLDGSRRVALAERGERSLEWDQQR